MEHITNQDMAKMTSSNPPTWSLTSHLLSVDKQAYRAATRAPFLEAAGQGRVSKTTLGKWLANDRLYTQAYIKAAGRTLASIDLPQTITASSGRHRVWTPQLVDWLCDTLVALRREDRLFVDVASRYGIPIDLEVDEESQHHQQDEGSPRVRDAAKIPGLIMFERLFGKLTVPMKNPSSNEEPPLLLPWLEAAVVFWGTEQVYSDAWTWAKQQQQRREGVHARGEAEDADGGALRKEFIPNWSSEEFVAFVGKLGAIVDGAVSGLVEVHGEGVKAGLVGRAEQVWRELVAAEGAFWPDVD